MRLSVLSDLERDLAETAARAGLHLRFDRVALRVVERLKSASAEIVPDGHAVIFTITAPIRHPGSTASAVRALMQASSPGARTRTVLHGNEVHLRWIAGVQANGLKAIGFVHNSEADAVRLLDLVEERLSEAEAT